MAVSYNIAKRRGDVVLIKDIPVFGVKQILTFIDITFGETSNRYFYKEFRIAINEGILFSDFIELTDGNLANFQYDTPQVFWVELKYTRLGDDNEGEIVFNSISFSGIFEPMPLGDYPVISKLNSIKKIVHYDTKHRILTRNLLEKLYGYGIVPNYVERGVGDPIYDKDYIQIFNFQAFFYALIIFINRDLEFYDKDITILKEVLKQKNIFVQENIDLVEALYIASNSQTLIAMRGGEDIFKKKDSRENRAIHGEFLRMIEYKEGDEFLYSVLSHGSIGWSLNSSSPLYKGSKRDITLNKAYSNSYRINIFDYPLVYPNVISVVEEENNKHVLLIDNPPVNTPSGVGNSNEIDKLITVDNNIDYDISFWAKISSQGGKLQFGIHSFDEDYNERFVQRIDNGQPVDILGEIDLPTNKWVFIRYYLYHTYKPLDTSPYILYPNIKIGVNARMHPKTNYIIPIIRLFKEDPVNLTLKLKELRIFPMCNGITAENSHSLGFINANNFLQIWFKNRGQRLDKDTIEINTEKFLKTRESTLLYHHL